MGPQYGKSYIRVFIVGGKISKNSRPITFKVGTNHPEVKNM
jgi:hypothetical protein